MKRLWMAAVSLVLTAMLWSPQVQAKGGNVDAFLRAPADREVPGSSTAAQRGLRIESTEPRLGVPAFVFGERALTDVPAASARALSPASADAAAREHMRGVADLYRLRRADVDAAELQGVHQPAIGAPGAVIARYGRRVNGIEVFRSELKVVMTAGHELVALSGYLAPPLSSDAQNAQASAFRLSGPQAIARAFGDVTGRTLDPRALAHAETRGDYRRYEVDPSLAADVTFATPPRVKQVLWPMPDALVPAYYVEVNAGSSEGQDADYLAYVISARDGAVLFKHDLTSSEAFSYRVWASPSGGLPHDGPQGTDATPHPTGLPDGYQAPLGQPANLVTLQNHPFSRNDPWLASNATQTVGNNVDAYADLGGGDGFQSGVDLRTPLSDLASRTFDYQYDVTRSPSWNQTQRHAAIVNLFYVNNFLHDWFYDAGFDEAAGNAQASNLGRGGLEGDSIRAEAQDYSGRNNANMSTPADGARPRMQMYVFDGVTELAVSAPASLARGYENHSAAFGPTSFDVSGNVALPPTHADPAVNEGLRLGCADGNGTTPYTGAPFAGKIALIERGVCSFVFKVLNAQQAGAIGVIVTNSATGAPGRMGASGIPAVDNAITIPSVLMLKPAADTWRAALAGGTTVALRLRKTADLDRDGTLDNDIVAHEWGHYLTNRLVGNASGLSNHQGRSLGEGWGDFVALLLQVRPEDVAKPQNANWRGVYGMAGYTMSGGGNQGYYWGIRRVPYSTDMVKNALTLKHIANGVPLPSHPVSAGQTGTNNAEVHNAGEVWATMLWECYAALLNAHPFEEGQDRMKRYLVTALKATPNQPTFLEARDALLAAAAANDPADYQRFLAAFAKRGAGFGAQVADRGSQDHIGVVESYQTGNTLEVVSIKLDDVASGCDRDGILDVGESGYLNVTVRNVGVGDLSGLTATAAFNGSTAGLLAAMPGGDTLNFGNLGRGRTATARIPVELLEAPIQGGIPVLGVDVSFPVNLQSGSRIAPMRAPVNFDEVANRSDTDFSNTVHTPWEFSRLGQTPLWENQHEGSLTLWHGEAGSVETDSQLTSPVLVGAQGQSFVLEFFQRYSFETRDGTAPYYDGGVLELSVDGGAWTDVFEFDWFAGTTANAGYVNYIDVNNPFLGDRPGYVGLSAGFPNFGRVVVNFGLQFQDRQVRFRFRIGTDGGVGSHGWDLTNIRVTGTVGPKPFPLRVAETHSRAQDVQSCNLRPVADPGAAQTVSERTAGGDPTVVTLSGEGSLDPDAQAGGTLTYQWTQRSGPAVTLSSPTAVSPTFTADVARDSVLVFELVVSDGQEASHPKTTQVMVRNVNRAPLAVAGVKDGGPSAVDERSGSITLDATGSSDPDGETLNFTWTQTAGTAVVLDDPTSATPTFTPPEVTADTTFSFVLVVDDGIDATDAAPLDLLVRQVDRAPVADAGAAQTVKARATVVLQGSATDVDGDAIDGWTWTQLEGYPVVLSGGDTATPSFQAPDVFRDTQLRFSLIATSNGLSSAASTVTLMVTRDNRRPVVQGSGPLTVLEGEPVTVQATSTDADGDPLTHQWTQVGGPTISLAGDTTLTLTFTAPEVKTDTVMVFRLVASDDLEASEPVEIPVLVRNVDRAPVAHAGVAQRVAARSLVTLQGSASDADGDAIDGLAWTQIAGPPVQLAGAETATPSFTAPDVTHDDAVLQFALVATANLATSAPGLVEVTVTRANRRPTLQGSTAVTALERTAVTLQAASADEDGDTITYQWTQLGGPAISLEGATTERIAFTAPEVHADTVVMFRLVAHDGTAASEPLEVAVTVQNNPRAPTAVTPASLSATEGDTVRLSAAQSSDPDGQVLTYVWEQVSGPAVTLSGADSVVATFTAPELQDESATASFRVTATDPDGLASTAEVTVALSKAKSGGCNVGGSGPSGLLLPALSLLGLLLLRRRREA